MEGPEKLYCDFCGKLIGEVVQLSHTKQIVFGTQYLGGVGFIKDEFYVMCPECEQRVKKYVKRAKY